MHKLSTVVSRTLFRPRIVGRFSHPADKATYGPDADEFRPERWLENQTNVPPPYHFTFGAGSRMCTAVNFSNRILYSIFFRVILSFKITQSKTAPPETDYIKYKRDAAASNAVQKDYKAVFAPRDNGCADKCLQKP